MRICFVFGEYNIGGAEHQALILARRFCATGHTISFLAFSDGPLKQKLIKEGFVAHVIDWSQNTRNDRRRSARSSWGRLFQVLTFLKVLRSNKIDVLMPYTITPNIRCNLLYKLTSTRICIWNQRDSGLSYGKSLIRLLASRLATAFISNSYEGVKYLNETFGVKLTKINIIENAAEVLNLVDFNRNQIRKNIQIDNNCYLVCMIGNLNSHKDHVTLLCGWTKFIEKRENVQSAHLLLAGRYGNTYMQILQLINDLHISENVHLLGFVENTREILAACDCGVFSSQSEGCPNGVLECMAAGLPVVATDIFAIRQIISNKNLPFLSPVGDSSGMAQALIFLEKYINERKLIGAANQKIILDRFGADKMFKKVNSVIEYYLKK
jgi:glycosyltransferase involved in cell wall biosynthesis